MAEVKTLLEEQGRAFETFKSGIEKSVKDEQTRLDEIEKRMNRPGATYTSGHGTAAANARKSLGEFARCGDTRGLERKAMSTDSDPDGGFFVPEEVDSDIEKLVADQSPMRGIANVKEIGTSDYKKIVNKGGLDAGWVGETEARPETGAPQLAELRIVPWTIFAQPKVTQDLLDDAGFDAAGWLVDEITEAFQLKEGAAFISGDGVKMPRGVLTYETSLTADAARPFGVLQHVPSGSATDITADAIVGMPWRLKAGYRQGAVWLMNSQTAAACMKLKDSQNRYLWTDSLTRGQPATLMGYPVVTDENMPDIAGNALPIAFGNFKRGYTIADRKRTSILRDPYTDKPYVKFYAARRVGGAVVNFHAVKLMKIAA